MKHPIVFTFIIICIIPHPFLFGQVKEPNFGEIIGITIPSVMITYGLISLGNNGIRKIDFYTHHSLEKNDRFWNTHVDDYMQFAPVVTAARERPDHSNNRSFPSGHTETAFVAAEFLHQEYKNQSVWISIGGYCAATFVGIARVYNNKHWISDVIAGAGIGILSTKVVYRVYPYIRKKIGNSNKPLHTFVFPVYSNGNMCINLSHTF